MLSIYRKASNPTKISFNSLQEAESYFGTGGIAGATFYLTVKREYDTVANDSTAIIALTWTTHVNGYETLIPFTPSNCDVVAGSYIYDVRMKKADEVYVIDLEGRNTFLVVDAVTRRA